MKKAKLFRRIGFYLLLMALSASTFLFSCKPAATDEHQPIAKHVVIIGVDGMSPDGVEHANTPNMHWLMHHGAYTLHARGVLPTSSSSNWASMISGAGTEQHGVTSNEWERDERNFPPVVTGSEDIFPTIFGTLRQQNKDAEIGAIYQWDGFGRLFEKKSVNYDVNPKDEYETAKTAAQYIKDKKPTFTFIHFDHVDGAGHGSGHGSPEYYKAVERADSLIGVVLQATKDAGIDKDMVLIVSADHGGIGYGHGGESLAELEIPFIVYGKGVKQDVELNLPIYTYDNAATVAFIFGLQQPYAWTGKPVKAAFEGYETPKGISDRKLLNNPTIVPKGKGYEPSGALAIDTPALVTIIDTDKGVQLRYTLDGKDPDSSSTLYTAPFKLSQSKVVKARAYAKGNKSGTVTAYFRISNAKLGNGLNYSYYEDSDLAYIPVFSKLKVIRTGIAPEFRYSYANPRPENFAIEFKGYLQIDSAGKYRFYTISDDGSALYIDGKRVVNNDGDHGTREKSGDVELTAGRHAIRVEYFNGGGGKWLDVLYKGPGIPKQLVAADKLYLKAQ